MRVVVITQIVPVVEGYTQVANALGHEVPAVIVGRPYHEAADAFVEAAGSADVVFAASKHSIAPVLRAYEADVGLCTGFPWLIPQAALDVPRLGIVNGHPSLLPRYRGPFPIAAAIRNGEPEIGVTYHLMDAGFDTGNVLAQKTVPLDDDETEESLNPKLLAASVELLPLALARIEAGDRGDPQSGGDYQSGDDLAGYVDVDLTQRAADVHRQVRAWSFVPPASKHRGPLLDGRRLLVTSLTEVDGAERVECADGPLWIVQSAPV